MLRGPATQWRFELAERMARAYAVNPKTRVVMVAGSVGRGTADAYSDLEIDVYYSSPPTEEERAAAVERCGAVLKSLAHDDVEWEERMEFDRFPAATSTFLVSTMEDYLHRVVDVCDPDEDAQVRLYSVQHAVPVYGEDVARGWVKKANAYPDGLVRGELERHLRFGALFGNVEMLVARNDLLALYDGIVDAGKRIIRALLALNRIYLPNPGWVKRLDEVVGEMAVKPEDLAARLKNILRDEPPSAVGALEDLIREVFDLVSRRRDDWDASVVERELSCVREVWTGLPR